MYEAEEAFTIAEKIAKSLAKLVDNGDHWMPEVLVDNQRYLVVSTNILHSWMLVFLTVLQYFCPSGSV